MKIFFLILFLLFSFPSFSQDWIDLSYSFNEKTIYWPTQEGFQLKEFKGDEKKLGYYHQGNVFTAPEHGGTHIDAPLHFNKFGKSVDQIPLRRLMGQAILIDLSNKIRGKANYEISEEDFLVWEKMNFEIKKNSIVFIRTGWDRYWKNRKKYLGFKKTKDNFKLKFPGLSAKAAQLLVERKISGIGIDTASLDSGSSQNFFVHRILMQNDIYGIENVANLSKIKSLTFEVIIAPMKISQGTGAPTRIFAKEN